MKILMKMPAAIANLSSSTKLLIIAAAVGLLLTIAVTVIRHLDVRRLEGRLSHLEQSSQEAREAFLKMEGKIESLSTELEEVNAQLLEAKEEEAKTNAELQNSRSRYTEVRRRTSPVFVSPDNDGKVSELNNLLDTLYPDSPNPR